MKKFLSSLLALTMILSLVIVPAQATNGYSVTGTATISGGTLAADGKIHLTLGDNAKKSVQLSVNDSELGLKKEADNSSVSGSLTKEYTWNVSNVSGGSGVVNYTTTTPQTSSNTFTAAKEGTVNVTCTVTVKGTDGTEVSASTTTKAVTIVVDDPQGDADADFASAIKAAGITYKGRPCTINSANTTITYYTISGEDTTSPWSTVPTGYTSLNYSVANEGGVQKLTITATPKTAISGVSTVTAKYTLDSSVAGLTLTSSITKTTAASEQVLSNGDITLTATYTGGTSNITYQWDIGDGNGYKNGTYQKTFSGSDLTVGKTYTIHCKVLENGVEAGTKDCTITVKDASKFSIETDPVALTMTDKTKTRDISATLKDNGVSVNNSSVKYSFTSNNTSIATVSQASEGSYRATVKLVGTGETYIKVTAEYLGGKIEKRVAFVGEVHEVTLDAVENGKSETYSYSELLSDANSVFKLITIKSIKVNTPVSNTYGTLKASTRYSDDYVFEAASGKIGVFTFNVTAYTGTSLSGDSYTVTFSIPVTPIETTYESQYPQPTGTSTSNYKYSVDVPDGYKSYYVVAKNPSKAPTDYSEKLSGTRDSYSGSTLYTLSESDFDKNGKCDLYVVTYDKNSDAYYGVISVYKKTYDITYNVVAGKTVTFDQKAFDSFLEDIADDSGDYNSRKDDLSFSYAVLTSSVPSTRSEGTLYDGSTAITSSNKSKTKMTNMDKVSFDTVSKPSKDTITLTFKVYGEVEKPNSRKPDEVKYDVNVVINVVKEDITYTVGIDDTVQLTARDFVNFLQDAKTSYRKAELDYVKFDVSGKNVSSYAYGGLYRSYSSYSTGKLADSTDKFYYEPSRTQYDLADVAYHTTRWAEAGKTVYIPFTVYGTKNEEASGTMAITIAQTMNFIDVKASDFFYEPVKWAVNNKITNGTSSTTFSPYKNCNRAEIVTFLWRAAGSPEPTSTRNPFTDVNSVRDASYYKAILWASQKGITAGTNATTFSPYQECTRSQIVTFLYRYAGKPSGYYSNPFKDVSSVNEASYYNAILWAVGKGITQGTSTTTFSPYASCTRGEAVTFLYRYVNGVK